MHDLTKDNNGDIWVQFASMLKISMQDKNEMYEMATAVSWEVSANINTESDLGLLLDIKLEAKKALTRE